RDRPRPPARDERRTARRLAPPRAAPPRRALRSRHLVCRRGPGAGGTLRAMTVAERYLELGLRLGRHEPELVDSYYGPEELRQRVDGEPLREPARLAADAAELLAAIEEPWLAAQVRALETTARTLAGEELPYAEEVELTYGIRPRWVEEEQFEQGHAMLDEALPGSGDLAARYTSWFEEAAVPPAAVEQAVDIA